MSSDIKTKHTDICRKKAVDTDPALDCICKKHTPLPWSAEVVDTQIGHCWKIMPLGACIYVDQQFLPREANNHSSIEAKANAELIVKAVNAYDVQREMIRELVEACKIGLSYMHPTETQTIYRVDKDAIKMVIAKAEKLL